MAPVMKDEYEVAIFLRESGTRHSLLTRQKMFGNDSTARTETKGNSTKLSEANRQAAATVSDDPAIMVESDDDDNHDANLNEIPLADPSEPENLSSISTTSTSKRSRQPRDSDKGNVDNTGMYAEEKKIGFDTQYEGFSIWGWVLCILVSRRNQSHRQQGKSQTGGSNGVSGQALMEEWISTQVQADFDDE